MHAALETYIARLHPGMKIRTTPVALLRIVASDPKALAALHE